MASKNTTLLTEEQRSKLVQLPDDVSDRLLARYHTLSEHDLGVIHGHRRDYNKLGFALQLCFLRFPGRVVSDITAVPQRVLSHIATSTLMKLGLCLGSATTDGERFCC